MSIGCWTSGASGDVVMPVPCAVVIVKVVSSVISCVGGDDEHAASAAKTKLRMTKLRMTTGSHAAGCVRMTWLTVARADTAIF